MSRPPTSDDIAKVLRSYLKDGRLTAMPRAGRKRQIVLDHVSQLFEPGLRYTEADVNVILREVWPDTAALRRHLVDAALLDRADGVYWRIGGPVELD